LDEGEGSSLILPPISAISSPEGKLYNIDNTLYWNNSPVGELPSENGWSLNNNNVVLSDPGSLIGIGTENPLHKLHIENGSIFTKGSGNIFYGLTVDNQEGRSVFRLRGSVTEENYNGAEIIMENLNSGSSWRMLTTGADEFSLVNHSAETGFAVPFKVEFGAPSNSLMINSNGNIGIGAISGDHKLAVAGGIISEEVIIKLQSNWPDYVFTEEYDLPSLDDVESHIENHGHLKGIPAADEIEEGGINIADVQIKLLEKIEELTLYVIDQDKKINRLTKDLAELKKNGGDMK
jgi:hypothetical protein